MKIRNSSRAFLRFDLILNSCRGATPKSPREHKKADRKLKGDNSSATMNPKTIQDYFVKSSATPMKDKQKLIVRHSPPTPTENHTSQKKTKMRGADSGGDSSDSDSQNE